jgi:hypothetical protein
MYLTMKQNVGKCNMMIPASSKFRFATSIFELQRCWFDSHQHALWNLLCVKAFQSDYKISITEYKWLYSGARSCLN